jgi:D-threo-aldose 1-dehydrogenase
VPLGAAALQFPLGLDNVAAVIPGAQAADEVATNLRLFALPIADEFWRELQDEGLLRSGVPLPRGNSQHIEHIGNMQAKDLPP